jgi:hypothetical protein
MDAELWPSPMVPSRYNRAMVPAEVVLDRWVRSELRGCKGFEAYLGKLNLDLESPSVRSFLTIIQDTMNEALRLEGINASGGVKHGQFHFDYLDVDQDVINAHAFPYEGFSFIVVTMPLVARLWRASKALCTAPATVRTLELNPATVRPAAIHALLLWLQLAFVTSHEYTHHIHRHSQEAGPGSAGVWSEFFDDVAQGSIDYQAQEIDADGYAAYLVLTHLIIGERRESALEQLGRADATEDVADRTLLGCFILAVIGFFCIFTPTDIDRVSIYRLTHPPAPVRIKHLVHVAGMWCSFNRPTLEEWLNPVRLGELRRTATGAIWEVADQGAWNGQVAFLSTADGDEYDRRLFETFNIQRQNLADAGTSVVEQGQARA